MEERMQELVRVLNEHAYRYYVLDDPTITDGEYDKLYDELAALEQQLGRRLPDSPTRRVGAEPLKAFESHAHLGRLWSLEKCKTKPELEAWQQRIDKLLDGNTSLPKPQYSLEYKIDGLTINLTYDGGRLQQAATRGNGSVGEGILPQVMTIKSVPLSIPFKGKFEVQGEGYMPVSAFNAYNETADVPLKNARNAAAGALRNLDPNECAKRNLDAFFYNIGFIQGERFANSDEMLGFLRENRFRVSPVLGRYDSGMQAYESAMELDEKRKQEDFLTDGMVIKVCDFKTRDFLGNTDRFPRWAIAVKYEAEEAVTRIEAITWDVGRSGKLTPLAHLTPVEIGGATVQRATLNNANDIERKGVKLGGQVWIRRSGDVIPEIMGSIGHEGTDVEIPTECPFCGAKVEGRGALLFCTNQEDCKPQLVYALDHFASREAMDIVGLSERTVRLLLDELGVRRPSDLYALALEQLEPLEGFGPKRAQNLLDALEQSKKRDLGAFIHALGIPGVGKATAAELAQRFHSIDALAEATVGDLVQMRDIGAIMADNIVQYFGDENNRAELARLKEAGVDPMNEQLVRPLDGALAGRNVVFTGTLQSMTRTQAAKLAAQHGAMVTAGITRKVNLVVAGENAGSKLDKASRLGIEVVSEDIFLHMAGQKGADS